MIILFWSFIILLTLIAMTLIMMPLLKSSKSSHTLHEKLNIALYKQRLLELKQLLQKREISFEDYQLTKQEMGKDLLSSVKPKKNSVIYKPAKKTALFLVIILPFFSISLYFYLGATGSLFHYWKLQRMAKLAQIELAKIKNPQQIIDELTDHLKTKPNSPHGWYLLGRLYFEMKNFKAAYQALSIAYREQPFNENYAVAYAEASFFYHNRFLNAEAIKILHDTIKHSKNNVAAINLLAVNAYFRGQYQTAINYWERLLPLFSEDNPDQQKLLKMISQAQQQLEKNNSLKYH